MYFPHWGNYNVDFLLCRKNVLSFPLNWKVKQVMFHSVKGEYRAVIAIKWFGLYSVDLVSPEMKKNAYFFMHKIKARMLRSRKVMKYSMSDYNIAFSFYIEIVSLYLCGGTSPKENKE